MTFFIKLLLFCAWMSGNAKFGKEKAPSVENNEKVTPDVPVTSAAKEATASSHLLEAAVSAIVSRDVKNA